MVAKNSTALQQILCTLAIHIKGLSTFQLSVGYSDKQTGVCETFLLDKPPFFLQTSFIILEMRAIGATTPYVQQSHLRNLFCGEVKDLSISTWPKCFQCEK
jgi:hypothetical protein